VSGTYADEQSTRTERPEVHGRSVGDLVSEVSNDLSTLMRQELALAKAEIKAEAAKTGKAAGMLGGAGFAGYMVALFVSIALWWALANGMDEGWAALIVAALWAIVGAVLYSMGRTRLKAVHPKPERTVQTLKEVPDALKGN
jgi:Putative Actinobacterial Holin-X, holin superfamily III